MPIGFDIIGDVHARFHTLEPLLRSMGYQQTNNGYAHPEGRIPIFIGDLIALGNRHAHTFSLVGPMYRNGNALALMGNHELDTIMMATRSENGKPIRLRTTRHLQSEQTFLAEYPQKGHKHDELIEWFKTFALFVESDYFRAVHAFWNDRLMETIRIEADHHEPCPGVHSWHFNDHCFRAYADPTTDFRRAVDAVIKGPHIQLPRGVFYTNSRGQKMENVPILHWREPTTDRPFAHIKGMDGRALTPAQKAVLSRRFNAMNADAQLLYPEDATPLFIGHYGLKDSVIGLRTNVWCVDHTDGITALRLDAGQQPEKFFQPGAFEVD
ncbi:MAG: hypothetical protein L6Q57_08440 [Alphaproteobacteria bacterium]|nr:hypothetical protein [Alphaproteobacteria bacterium]